MRSRTRIGFTLVELLVVIAIVAIVIGLIVVAVVKVREAANKSACMNNLKQIAVATHAYHMSQKKLPHNSMDGPYGPYGPNTKAWSWMSKLLPYLEQGSLFQRAKVDLNTLHQSRDSVAMRVEVFLCPTDLAYGQGPRDDAADLGMWNPPFISAGNTNYKGVGGANWMWGDRRWRNNGTNGQNNPFVEGDGLYYRDDGLVKRKLGDIKDGLSTTFMIGEAVPERSKWTCWAYANNAVGTCAIAPNAKQRDGSEFDSWDWTNTYSFHSRHSGGLYFAMADSSVRFIGNDIDLATYRALATIAGRESVTIP